MRFVSQLCLPLACYFFLIPLHSLRARAETLHLLKGGAGVLQYEVSGSGYKTKAESSVAMLGEYSFTTTNSAWRLGAEVAGTPEAEFLNLSAGGDYHFIRMNAAVSQQLENVSYTSFPILSPYLGLRLGFSRVQISLQSSTSSSSNIIAGSVVGPSIRGGTIYSLNQDWKLDFCLYSSYGFSPQVATTVNGININLIFVLPIKH